MIDSLVYSFDQIFSAEAEAINARRARRVDGAAAAEHVVRRVDAAPAQAGSERIEEPRTRAAHQAARETVDVKAAGAENLVGLAFSGGGVRSAAVCLGVAQGLDALSANDTRRVFDRIDYLSAVSGGGYMAASIVAAMNRNGGEFPFRSQLDQQETAAIKHIRDHSNYLLPRGFRDAIVNLMVMLRGLTANVAIIFPVLLALALFTIISNPTYADLKQADIAGWRTIFGIRLTFEPLFGLKSFHFTSYLLPMALLFLFLQILFISAHWSASTLAGRQKGGLVLFGLTLIVAIVAFCEFQTFVLKAMFALDPIYAESTRVYEARLAAEANVAQTTTMRQVRRLGPLIAIIQNAWQTLLPIALALLAFGKQLINLLDIAGTRKDWRAAVMRLASRAALYVAALAVFLLLWFSYLLIAYWGIDARAEADFGPVLAHVPNWLQSAAAHPVVSALAGWIGLERQAPVAQFYGALLILLLILWLFIGPNANSLHRLYRDRLSQAFVFDPSAPRQRSDGERDPDRTKFSRLDPTLAPYLLANTALNLQSSPYLKRRGRRADFFLFSPLFIGSEATGYARTARVEELEGDVTLPTAMAISGAAASSHMGAHDFGPLSFALAVLNVRLGYWLKNPARIEQLRESGFLRRAAEIGPIAFLREAFGRIGEESLNVYLTDGGHVENLGVYELLRRRCRVIIAVDAEADPGMTFPSFARLQRMARIDLGVRIHLNWAGVAEATRRYGDPAAVQSPDPATAPATQGPHGAIGIIEYLNGPPGVLFYLKSSMTGDENDYIKDYKRRYPAFPHEATADQFFSEEQFEVYRALGFHMARGMFTGADECGLPPVGRDPTFIESLRAAFASLGLATPASLERRMADQRAVDLRKD